MQARPPLLPYIVVASGMLALAAALLGDRKLLVIAGLCGYIGAMIESVTFLLRARHRRSPAVLLGAARTILGVTLLAMTGVLLANAIVALRVSAGHAVHDAGAVIWPMLVGVLAWRAWLVPSARRAAILQLVAIVFAMPGMISVVAAPLALPAGSRAVSDTALFVGFIVIAAAGAVLDRLYASLADRGPERVPAATLRS